MLARQVLPLIIAYANKGEPVGGRTRFQKMIFVLQNEARFLKETYNFMPHDYGPYSAELQSDIEDLISTKFLSANRQTIDEGKIRYVYEITPPGVAILKKVLSSGQLDRKFKFNRALTLAVEIKEDLNRKDLNSLLGDIYAKYPEFARYSKFMF